MKTLIIASALFGSLSTSAATIVYDCGSSYGREVSLTITSNVDGSFYRYTAVLKAPGRDETTGTLLRSVTSTLEGDVETYEGKKYFHLADSANPVHQVIAEKPTKVGDKVEVADLNIKKQTERNYECEITKFVN